MSARANLVLRVVNRLGVPSAILGIVLWLVVDVVREFKPDVHEFFGSAVRQLDVVSEAVPKMQHSLDRIADDLPALRTRIDQVEAKIDRALGQKRGS